MLVVALGTGSVAVAQDDNQALIERIKPLGQVHVKGAVTESAGGTRSGEAVYQAACVACHGTGALGAPKLADQADWQPRIDERGFDTLLDHALNGFNAMPARGACGDCSDDEIQAAIEFMTDFK
ncbi:c-type cytochrome [Alteromonas sp. a30]|uniref:c-type cytochrome n=1 Tax=Alteromonas sp. a30 TaxID=2730917 RepID=UPI00227F786A|nr:c-type cytochrome [Alteromonas sp. a30]MCY7294938.1 cytochrome c5 family protein [Alteromonas sp. a30]